MKIRSLAMAPNTFSSGLPLQEQYRTAVAQSGTLRSTTARLFEYRRSPAAKAAGAGSGHHGVDDSPVAGRWQLAQPWRPSIGQLSIERCTADLRLLCAATRHDPAVSLSIYCEAQRDELRAAGAIGPLTAAWDTGGPLPHTSREP
jgi:hypothetical protein